MKNACLIIIGNEILSGRTQDKNLAWLAVQLGECGTRLANAQIIPDVEEVIIKTVRHASEHYDVVFTTGGIGPTHDDITAASVARAFGVDLHLDPSAHATLLNHYGEKDLNEARLKMAYLPQGAVPIANPISAAPGFRIRNVYVFAGIPSVMQAMFANMRHELGSGPKIYSRSISAFVTEGVLAAGLADIQREFPEVEIGSYPFFQHGKLGTSIVMRAIDTTRLDLCFEKVHFFFSHTLEVACQENQ